MLFPANAKLRPAVEADDPPAGCSFGALAPVRSFSIQIVRSKTQRAASRIEEVEVGGVKA